MNKHTKYPIVIKTTHEQIEREFKASDCKGHIIKPNLYNDKERLNRYSIVCLVKEKLAMSQEYKQLMSKINKRCKALVLKQLRQK